MEIVKNETDAPDVAEAESPPDQASQVIAEIKIQAMSNGEVAITMPVGLTLWSLRGILAKAVDSACGLEVTVS